MNRELPGDITAAEGKTFNIRTIPQAKGRIARAA
jgi:hypothetical protein